MLAAITSIISDSLNPFAANYGFTNWFWFSITWLKLTGMFLTVSGPLSFISFWIPPQIILNAFTSMVAMALLYFSLASFGVSLLIQQNGSGKPQS